MTFTHADSKNIHQAILDAICNWHGKCLDDMEPDEYSQAVGLTKSIHRQIMLLDSRLEG